MKKIIVNGGRKLQGDLTVSGSKNAALPIIFACILTNGVSEIDNLPDIGDVRAALSLLSSFGAKIERRGSLTFIDTRELSYIDPDVSLTSKIRASTYLLGSCLSRFGRCPMLIFGGCNFSHRPIDMHLDACLALGAHIDGDMITADRLKGNVISFRCPSVGATVNSILLAASAEGETLLRGCAVEPHIDALIDFLNSCGASIIRQGREIRICGRELHGGKITVIGDYIEAGSYIALGLMCGSVRVKNAPLSHMSAVLDSLSSLGATFSFEDNLICAHLISKNFISLTTAPYPAFPTDLQPIFAPLMAVISGGEIIDTVWRERFGYLDSLSHFGILSQREDNRARIFRSKIHSGKTVAPDLRGGMACLMTALAAEGQSEIDSLEIILRGYENLEKKLRTLGAEIKIEDT